MIDKNYKIKNKIESICTSKSQFSTFNYRKNLNAQYNRQEEEWLCCITVMKTGNKTLVFSLFISMMLVNTKLQQFLSYVEHYKKRI